jgi:hypothetical protein
VRKRDDESWYNEDFIYEKQTGKSIMIWAMIDEFGLVRMKWLNEHKKKIDSEYFIQEILEKHVVIWNGFQKDSPKQWIFQQDNAPIHGSTMTTEYLED